MERDPELQMNVYKDSGFRLPWRPWMATPCYVCGRQMEDSEPRFTDLIAHVVICEPCSYGGCSCRCHQTVQPGLIPCPTCEHISRCDAGGSMEP